uniref:CLAVATA3/ESR (CLE)-related protein 9 n=1 Tax=Ananas comosus var. bracteatus TaxID=296719 RepID=A0A6V7PNC4_ANACO|nr:unnamed protein product [Ananas comosus var. bracteatus]
MKSSYSTATTTIRILGLLLYISILIMITSKIVYSTPSLREDPLARFSDHYRLLHRRHLRNHNRHHESSSFITPSCLVPPFRCKQSHGSLPRPPPTGEIDPRYGVEKRLVPTGPNPLHN